MSETMPEWFIDILRTQENFELPIYEDDTIEDMTRNAFQEGIKKCFEILSKPENLKKIDAVRELVKEATDMVDKIENDYSTSWLEDALKPFEGSDE